MAEFNIAHRTVMTNEGGCNFNPHDLGNVVDKGVVIIPTYKGIAPTYWRSWRGFPIITRAINSLVKMMPYGTREHQHWVAHLDQLLAELPSLQELVLAFYRVNFWDAHRLGGITDQAVATWAYDHAVNGGGRGIKWLQEAAGVTPDGAIGDISLAAINAANPEELLERAGDIAAFYRLQRAAAHPDQIQFLSSWLKRDGCGPAEIRAVLQAAKDGELSAYELAELKELIAAA